MWRVPAPEVGGTVLSNDRLGGIYLCQSLLYKGLGQSILLQISNINNFSFRKHLKEIKWKVIKNEFLFCLQSIERNIVSFMFTNDNHSGHH